MYVVFVVPPEILVGPEPLIVEGSREFNLSCLATGQPAPTIIWLLNRTVVRIGTALSS